jgi:hypothetical protein
MRRQVKIKRVRALMTEDESAIMSDWDCIQLHNQIWGSDEGTAEQPEPEAEKSRQVAELLKREGVNTLEQLLERRGIEAKKATHKATGRKRTGRF